MKRVLLLLVLSAGCRATDDKPQDLSPPVAKTGPAPLQVTQGPPPSYFVTDNVDSNTSTRSGR